jgi:hypothetical protein
MDPGAGAGLGAACAAGARAGGLLHARLGRSRRPGGERYELQRPRPPTQTLAAGSLIVDAPRRQIAVTSAIVSIVGIALRRRQVAGLAEGAPVGPECGGRPDDGRCDPRDSVVAVLAGPGPVQAERHGPKPRGAVHGRFEGARTARAYPGNRASRRLPIAPIATMMLDRVASTSGVEGCHVRAGAGLEEDWLLLYLFVPVVLHA